MLNVIRVKEGLHIWGTYIVSVEPLAIYFGLILNRTIMMGEGQEDFRKCWIRKRGESQDP